MTKMMGKIHSRQCDCGIPQFVSGKSEKCNKIHGNKRRRAREKRSWRKDIVL